MQKKKDVQFNKHLKIYCKNVKKKWNKKKYSKFFHTETCYIEYFKANKFHHYGLLDVLRAHRCAHNIRASQILTEKSINKKLENGIFDDSVVCHQVPYLFTFYSINTSYNLLTTTCIEVQSFDIGYKKLLAY